jgi:hypothetical protein
MTEIIAAASEQLSCKLLGAPEYFCRYSFCIMLITLCLGICLDLVVEDHRVSVRVAALERVSSDTTTFWSGTCHRDVVVQLQDHAQHIEEVVEGCRRALTTMFSVMLPRNPFHASFRELLDVFKTSRSNHRLIELNLIASANFALAWARKWHPHLNFNTMS